MSASLLTAAVLSGIAAQMSSIVSPSSLRATVSSRNSIQKVASNFVDLGYLSEQQVSTAQAITSNCTVSNPCKTPNCKTCSSNIYTDLTNSTSTFIKSTATNYINVYAVTICSNSWIVRPPYNLSHFINSAAAFTSFLRIIPDTHWTMHYDLAMQGTALQPHIHGTFSGTDELSIRESIEAGLEIAGIDYLPIHIQPLTKTNAIKPTTHKDAHCWSKYQHKIQRLNTNSCRTALDINTNIILRVLASTLLCDTEHTASNLEDVPKHAYKLHASLSTAVHDLATLGLTELSQRITLDLTTVHKNSRVIENLQRIRFSTHETQRLRDATNKYAIRESRNPFTMKLLICLLSTAAHQHGLHEVSKKLVACWPKAGTPMFWNEWLDLLLA